MIIVIVVMVIMMIVMIMIILMVMIILIMIQVLFVWGHSEHGKSDGEQRPPLQNSSQSSLTAGAGSEQRHSHRNKETSESTSNLEVDSEVKAGFQINHNLSQTCKSI